MAMATKINNCLKINFRYIRIVLIEKSISVIILNFNCPNSEHIRKVYGARERTITSRVRKRGKSDITNPAYQWSNEGSQMIYKISIGTTILTVWSDPTVEGRIKSPLSADKNRKYLADWPVLCILPTLSLSPHTHSYTHWLCNNCEFVLIIKPLK